jgi:hypothetical protein
MECIHIHRSEGVHDQADGFVIGQPVHQVYQRHKPLAMVRLAEKCALLTLIESEAMTAQPNLQQSIRSRPHMERLQQFGAKRILTFNALNSL